MSNNVKVFKASFMGTLRKCQTQITKTFVNNIFQNIKVTLNLYSGLETLAKRLK